MSLLELKAHVEELKKLQGAQLQEIESHKHGFALGLYLKGLVWWILDLRSQAPMSLVFYEVNPWKQKDSPKPVSLFLNSHGKNLLLSSVELLSEQGRVFKVLFEKSERQVEVEVQLIPKAANLIVRAKDKSISWQKPRELSSPPVVLEDSRELTVIKEQWLSENVKTSLTTTHPETTEIQFEKAIAKKQRAIESIENQLSQAEDEKLFAEAEALKAAGDSRMQSLFEKAKAARKKKQGTEERLQVLRNEMVEMKRAFEAGVWSPQLNSTPKLLKKAEVSGRTKIIEGIVASRGKSAKDNLTLLRAAKAWDLWMHLRDYPGSHLILSVTKGQKVSQQVLQQAALWLAESSIKSKAKMSGLRFDVLVTECRFVRPIKGDKLGRVNYQNERVFTLVIP